MTDVPAVDRGVLYVVKGLDLGGVERVVTDLAIAMHARGIRVEVALVNPARDRLVPVLEAAGVAVHRLGGSDRVGVPAARRLRALMSSGQFGVVHAHGPWPAVIARSARRRPRGRRTVTTFHTMWSALRFPSRLALQLTARRDDHTVAVSQAVAQSLPAPSKARAIVIPHGIDLAACAAAGLRAPLLRATLASADEVLVVTVASHRPAKNYPNLLRAVAAARATGAPIRLLAVGEGAALGAHQQLAAQLGLDGNVTFAQPRTDVLDVIAAADVFVMASDFEGQPLVVVEAMGTGRPIVATSVGRTPELISSEVGRLVPPDDSHALAAALVELAMDRPLRTRLGAASLEAVRPHSLEASIDAHLELYARARLTR